MSETVTFTNFITKGLSIDETDGRRVLKGHITSEVVDRQDEFVAVNEVLAIIKNYFEVFPAINDWHSNRIVGKAYKYEKSEIEGHPSVYIEAEIFKKDGVTLYDQVWEKIQKGEYKGFSMGGASKNREPLVKNGKLVMNLKNLELYEISVCPIPANPFAVIDYVNPFAKASNLEIIKNEDGKERIQCQGVQCEFYKMEKQDKEETKNIIEREHELLGEKPDEKEKKVHEELISEAKKSLEEFIVNEIKKQYQAFNKPVRGHTFAYWQNKLKEENPEYTDEVAAKIIGSWEQEENVKKQETREANSQKGTNIDNDNDIDNDNETYKVLKSIKFKNDLILTLLS